MADWPNKPDVFNIRERFPLFDAYVNKIKPARRFAKSLFSVLFRICGMLKYQMGDSGRLYFDLSTPFCAVLSQSFA